MSDDANRRGERPRRKIRPVDEDDSEIEQQASRKTRRKKTSADAQSIQTYTVMTAIGGAFSTLLFQFSKNLAMHSARHMPNEMAGSMFAVPIIALAVIGIVVLPIMVISAMPGMFRFLVGAPSYRKRWVMLQSLAWVMLICFAMATAIITQDCFERGLSDSTGISLMNSIPAGIGFYLIVMSFMPEDFFENDYMGKKVMKFLGCKSTSGARMASRAGAAALIGVSVGLSLIAVAAFARR
jgi:hypothetical protein